MNGKENSGDDEHRRSFMKKGGLAAGALALGGSGLASAQQGGQQGGEGTVLIPTNNYVKGGQFQVIGEVQTNLTLSLLEAAGVPSPGNYSGYVIQYTFTEMPYYALLFVNTQGDSPEIQTQSQAGQGGGPSYTFQGDPTFFTGQGEWISTSITQSGGGGS